MPTHKDDTKPLPDDVAFEPGRGQRILRDASWLEGRRQQAQGFGAGGSSVADASSTGREGRELGGTRDTDRGGAEAHGSVEQLRGLFAPGPGDPKWSSIVSAAPWLAPALGEPTKRLNPRFVEWLMGLPIGWTEVVDGRQTAPTGNDQQGRHPQTCAACRVAKWRELLQMRIAECIGAAPPGLFKADHQNMQESQLSEGDRQVECEKAMALRRHRLRAIGNGGVPLTTAVAFAGLARRVNS